MTQQGEVDRKRNKEADSNDGVALGQAANALVHDLANLLQTMLLRAEIASTLPAVPPDCVTKLDELVREGQSGVAMLRALLETSRAKVAQLAPLDLEPLVQETLTALSPDIPTKVFGPLPPVRADAGELADLLGILLELLQRGATPNTRLTLSLRGLSEEQTQEHPVGWLCEAGWAQIAIHRDGPGEPLELEDGALPHPSPEGVLSPNQIKLLRARGIVRRHRGLLQVSEQVDDSGPRLTLRILLPGACED